MMLAFIPPVINAHGYDEYDDATGIEDRLHKFTVAAWILVLVFVAIAIINLLVCVVYDRKEKKRAEVIR